VLRYVGVRAERAGEAGAVQQLLQRLFRNDYRIVGVEAKVGSKASLALVSRVHGNVYRWGWGWGDARTGVKCYHAKP
jgi:hypothetical protein